jgi:hypothetical protein
MGDLPVGQNQRGQKSVQNLMELLRWCGVGVFEVQYVEVETALDHGGS